MKIYTVPPMFSTTLLLYKLDTLLLKHRPSPEYSCRKRNPLHQIQTAFFVSIVLYLMHIINSGANTTSIVDDDVSKLVLFLQW